MRQLLVVGTLVLGAACAHRTVVAADLERVHHPAILSRIDMNAGPQARVFREDGVWRKQLDRLDPREADRRLSNRLGKVVTRFQVSDGLRASLLALLPKEPPWTTSIPPGNVASALDSFLVEEVPANPPDYELLRRIGADSVLELVVEDYGMHSEQGRAQAFVTGYGRLFLIGGPIVWHHAFSRDNVTAGVPGINPFEIAKHPELYRDAFGGLIEGVAEELAKELRPVQPRPEPAPPVEAPPPPKAPAPAPPPVHHPEEEL